MRNSQVCWTDKEKHALCRWINSNPNVKVSYKFALPELLEMFPERTPNAIYAQWRETRIKTGYSSVGDDHAIAPKRFDLISVINLAVNKWINEQQDNTKISYLEAENRELKKLLCKLTKVREAVEEFKL